jgi:hypothetical protein
MSGDADKRTRTEMKLDRVGDGDVLELGRGKGRVSPPVHSQADLTQTTSL